MYRIPSLSDKLAHTEMKTILLVANTHNICFRTKILDNMDQIFSQFMPSQLTIFTKCSVVLSYDNVISQQRN